jgi:uncharacterized protein
MEFENISNLLNSEDFGTLKALIEGEKTLVLSTVDENGDAYSTPLYYVSDEYLNLYFYSSSNSNHSLHLSKNSTVSLGLFNNHNAISELKGLQIKADCVELMDSHEEYTAKLNYFSKFANLVSKELLEKEIISKSLYKIRPYWLKLVDNSIDFGFKKEWGIK